MVRLVFCGMYKAGEYGVRSRQQIEEELDRMEWVLCDDSEFPDFSPLTCDRRGGFFLNQMQVDQQLAPHMKAIEDSERLTADDYNIWIGPAESNPGSNVFFPNR